MLESAMPFLSFCLFIIINEDEKELQLFVNEIKVVLPGTGLATHKLCEEWNINKRFILSRYKIGGLKLSAWRSHAEENKKIWYLGTCLPSWKPSTIWSEYFSVAKLPLLGAKKTLFICVHHLFLL